MKVQQEVVASNRPKSIIREVNKPNLTRMAQGLIDIYIRNGTTSKE
ncbi:hypothetical protein [Bacillus coahuilensis]|nr:hypothetical protein [Bacillus coahuilensis]